MKRYIVCVLLAICMVAGSLFISGCDSDGDGTVSAEEALVGFWLLNRVRMVGAAEVDGLGLLSAGDVFDPALIAWVFTLNLRADLTYTISQTMFGEPATIEEGTWSSNSSSLTVVMGERSDVYPYTLDGNQLTLHMATSTDPDFPADLILQR